MGKAAERLDASPCMALHTLPLAGPAVTSALTTPKEIAQQKSAEAVLKAVGANDRECFWPKQVQTMHQVGHCAPTC